MTIQIKRGLTEPTTSDLIDGELGFNKENNRLYIGGESMVHELFGPGTMIIPYEDYRNLNDIDDNIRYFCTDDFDEILTADNGLINMGITATVDELNYVDGVTSNIQTQLNSKQATITGGATTITSSNLTVSRALISNTSGKVAVSAVTSTELGYLDGVTSNIQTQLNDKAASSHYHKYLKGTNGCGGVRDTTYDDDPCICVVAKNSSGTDDTSIIISFGGQTYQLQHVYTKQLTVYEGRVKCLPSYENTTTYATNCYIGTNGLFTRTTNTSSKTIKHDIKLLENDELNPEKLYDVEICQFKYNDDIITDKNDARYMKELPGFIIEDLEEKYPIAVDKPSDDSETWSWNKQYLIPPMVKLLQDQKKEIDELKRKIKAQRSD